MTPLFETHSSTRALALACTAVFLTLSSASPSQAGKGKVVKEAAKVIQRPAAWVCRRHLRQHCRWIWRKVRVAQDLQEDASDTIEAGWKDWKRRRLLSKKAQHADLIHELHMAHVNSQEGK